MTFHNNTDEKEAFYSFLDKVDVVEMLFYWSILAVGVPCNIVVAAMLVIRKKLRNHAYQLIILAIAIADMFVLFTVCFLDSLFLLHRWGKRSIPWLTFHCKYLSVLEFTATISSVWFVVLFSLERFYASVKPEEGRLLFSRRKCLKYIGVIVGLSFLSSLPHVLVKHFNSDTRRCITNEVWEVGVYVYHVLLLHVLPIGVMVFCNVAIIHNMYAAKKRYKERAQSAIVNKTIPRKAIHRATFFLLGLSVCYTVLYMPKLCTDLFLHLIGDDFASKHLHNSKAFTVINRISEFMYLSNSLVNFFVYSTMSPSFRRHLAKLFFIHLQAWRDSLESVDTRATSLHNGISIESLDVPSTSNGNNNVLEVGGKTRSDSRRWSSRDLMSINYHEYPNTHGESNVDDAEDRIAMKDTCSSVRFTKAEVTCSKET